ncbi:Na/Pi cotransporter family protein [uncultured Treponema sp.]|uniref:Na/Pi cotransporter family protein n=1 Tax=uncultured Treponema sp. TaxID=162155 RepID=UPI0015BF2A9D|nr:Na/Pi cotransporter family protein [uncultured Treponema sp.]
MILNIVGQVFGFVGSLCLLLFGMNMLSDGIQKGAGSNLQKLLGKIAGNRFTAVLTGIGVTAIIQSSGATTVMVVSFVNAEMLTLRQAIGVIFGANIGTTVTAWIVSLFGFSFSIADAAIPLFGIGFLLKRLKRFKIHNFADCFMGFAILFMGLDLLQKTLTLSPESADFLRRLTDFGIGGLLIGVFVGAFVTALIHSSSAMTAIVLTMAANNFLTWELSAAMVLGSNIGSTIDAVMSSFGASINAKRTALVHVLFNVVGTVIVLCVFNPFLGLVDMIVPGTPASNITTHIAMLHTIFNLCSTLIFLPFVDQIAFLATKIISSSSKEDNSHYKFPAILPNSHVSADVYLFQIQKEISKMSAKIMEMFDIISNTLISVGKSPAEVDIEKSVSSVQQAEEYIDEMNEAITHFLQHVSHLPNANHDDRIHFYHLITITDSLESLSDENSSIMYTLKKYIESESFNFLSDQTKKICGYLESVRLFYERVCVNFTIGMTGEQKYEYEKLEDEIDRTKKSLKYESRKRIETGSDVKAELAYIDLVRKIEKAGDCIYTIVQAI